MVNPTFASIYFYRLSASRVPMVHKDAQISFNRNRRKILSYDLYVWDPTRHAPLPSTAEEAYDMKEELSESEDNWNSTLAEFGNELVQRFETNPLVSSGAMEAFWGADPRKVIADCKSAALCLSLPAKECMQQIAYAVEAAAALGLVVFDDNYGTCFLPNGKILPEDMQAIWESDLVELKADIADPHRKKTDGRNILQRIAGELFDAIGRGDKKL
jgi:hypothetical protein